MAFFRRKPPKTELRGRDEEIIFERALVEQEGRTDRSQSQKVAIAFSKVREAR